MAANIIDGEAVAAKIREGLAGEIEALKAAGKPVKLAALQANDNVGSRIYVKSQKRDCEAVGIDYQLVEMAPDSSAEAMEAKVDELNGDPSITGIILQMPVPDGVDQRALQQRIAGAKDVEGMHRFNQGGVVYGDSSMSPCTAFGAFLLAKGLDLPPSYDKMPAFARKMLDAGKTTESLYGKEVVVVGHSEIVGKPCGLMFLDQFCTVATCHVATKNLAEHTKRADILVVATGAVQGKWSGYRRALKKHDKDPEKNKKPVLPENWALITADMIKPGAAVIDVAINRVPKGFDDDGRPVLNEKGKPAMVTVGDVDFEAAKGVAGWITPVPGGVGPMTVAVLLKNTVEAAKIASGQ